MSLEEVHMITLNNIAKLINDMILKSYLQQQFKVKYNSRIIDIILFLDVTPYQMLIGVEGTQVGFVTNISKMGEVEDWIHRYYELRIALGIHGKNGCHFTPTILFGIIDQNAPAYAQQKFTPLITSRYKYIRDVEEADKVYFCGWRFNGVNGTVKLANLEKTKLAFGKDAQHLCKAHNISSKWTDIQAHAQNYSHPLPLKPNNY